MNRKAIQLTLLFLIATFAIQAQSSRAVVNTELAAQNGRWQSQTIQVPLDNPSPFIALSLVWGGEQGSPEVRFSPDGSSWGDWEQLKMETHAEQRPGHWVSQLYFADEESRFVQIRAAMNMGEIEAHFYNPGPTKAKKAQESTEIETRDPVYCPCPQPAYEGRLDWCPDGSCPEDATPQFTAATHLIIHHSAGTNTANDWAAIVRSIWDFHVFSNGWDDIGYNWLIDPNGVIYEGRGDGRLGAHFCGTNGATMGTCVLGDFTNTTPTDDAIAALTDLFAWKTCDISVDPLGTFPHSGSGLILKRISGHRDGCSTQCPGNSFYPMLPGVREGVAEHIATSCAAIGAPNELVATASSDTSIVLDWVDITDNETGFQLERSTSFNGGYSLIATLTENIETYEDTGLTPETGYYYRVRAFNDQDTSIYSNKAFAATVIVDTDAPSLLSNFKVYPNPTEGQVFIEWKNPVSASVVIRLLDVSGKALTSRTVPGSQQKQRISTEGLPAGFYWLEISNQGLKQSYKLIKK